VRSSGKAQKQFMAATVSWHAWDKVCKPIEYGGLGIMNLKILGYALRIRWLWLQKLRDGCWTDFQLSPEPEVKSMFDASIRITVACRG
jgi:hypothetical protein